MRNNPMLRRRENVRLIFLCLLLLSLNANAGTQAENYCAYLQGLIEAEPARMQNVMQNSPGDTKSKIEALMEAKKPDSALDALEIQAIGQKKSFEQFKEMAAAKGKTVHDLRRYEYLGKYSRRHCQVIQTEATTNLNTGVNTRSIQIKSQFDPDGHAYYEDYKKNLRATK